MDWAERYYLLALERNPNDLGLLSTLGELYKDGFHNYTKALDCYDKMLRIDPLHYDAMEAKGLLLFNYLKDYTKAIEVLENALEHYPDDQNLQTWLADVYMTINTSEAFEKGKKILLEVLENAPTDSLALTIYANQLWITKNNPKEAQKIYLKILDASNHHYNALGNLAELYYLEFQEYNIAQEHYAKAFALYMDDIYHLCNYISLLTLELNELEDAKDYYQHLLTLCYKEIPREPEMRDEQWTRFKEAEKKLVVYITDSTN